MKKRYYGIILFIFVILLIGLNNIIAAFGMIIFGRNGQKSPVKADDELSKILIKEFEGELTYYGGDKNGANGRNGYGFKIEADDPELIERLAGLINDYLLENSNKKVNVGCSTSINMPGGLVFGFMNYDKSGIIDDQGIVGLYIYSSEYESEFDNYMMPERYKNIPNIKYLEIDEVINKIATEQGVDWYEYWPDLVEVDIVE